MLYPPEFCSEHVAGNCLLFCSKCVPCDSAFPLACAIYCYCLSVSVCGRKPAGTEDLPKHSEELPEQSDQDGDCRWTTGSRRFGTAPATIWFRSGLYKWQQSEEYAGRLCEERAASCNWRIWDQHCPNVCCVESIAQFV